MHAHCEVIFFFVNRFQGLIAPRLLLHWAVFSIISVTIPIMNELWIVKLEFYNYQFLLNEEFIQNLTLYHFLKKIKKIKIKTAKIVTKSICGILGFIWMFASVENDLIDIAWEILILKIAPDVENLVK